MHSQRGNRLHVLHHQRFLDNAVHARYSRYLFLDDSSETATTGIRGHYMELSGTVARGESEWEGGDGSGWHGVCSWCVLGDIH